MSVRSWTDFAKYRVRTGSSFSVRAEYIDSSFALLSGVISAYAHGSWKGKWSAGMKRCLQNGAYPSFSAEGDSRA
jgi:hypothetical protein